MISEEKQLTEEQYDILRWSVISLAEGIKWVPYLDTADPPQITIGVGFNIHAVTELRVEIYRLLGINEVDGFDDSKYFDRLEAAIDSNDLDELNNIMQDRFNAATPEQQAGMPSSFTIPHDDLEAAIQKNREIFEMSAGDPANPDAETYEARLNDWLGSETLVTSSERVDLLSLMYNGVLSKSKNLKDAVQADNRIRAWFEIRYGSNPAKDGVRDSGLAKLYATDGLDQGDTSVPDILEAITHAPIDHEVVIGLETNGAILATDLGGASNGNDLLNQDPRSGL